MVHFQASHVWLPEGSHEVWGNYGSLEIVTDCYGQLRYFFRLRLKSFCSNYQNLLPNVVKSFQIFLSSTNRQFCLIEPISEVCQNCGKLCVQFLGARFKRSKSTALMSSCRISNLFRMAWKNWSPIPDDFVGVGPWRHMSMRNHRIWLVVWIIFFNFIIPTDELTHIFQVGSTTNEIINHYQPLLSIISSLFAMIFSGWLNHQASFFSRFSSEARDQGCPGGREIRTRASPEGWKDHGFFEWLMMLSHSLL